MTIAKKLSAYLDEKKIRYERIVHSKAYTAQETAQAEHAPGKAFAKVVMVRADNRSVMAVMPATHRLDLEQFKKLLRARSLRLATEEEFEKLFADCEVGAMPPFGNIYKLPVYVDQSLSDDENIVFNAGTHRESVKISFSDYQKLIRPQVCSFAVKMA